MKYAVDTKWCWPNGIMDANEIQSHMRKNLKDKSVADNIILWKIYENRHQSVIIYPSEESAKTKLAKRLAKRTDDIRQGGIKLLKEYTGPVLAQMTGIW